MSSLVRSRRRIRRIGKAIVPLDDVFAECVSFIVTDVVAPDGTPERQPLGTGFFLSHPTQASLPPGSNLHEYLVTAAHVVRGVAQTMVRVNTGDGGVEDLPVPEWTYHPTEDVAVAPVAFDRSRTKQQPLWPGVIPILSDYRLGERVYFVGLLGRLSAMVKSNTPIVRSGTLGRLDQPGIPLRWPNGDLVYVTAHLIDCRSYNGFSGSPCFIQKDAIHVPNPGFSSDTFKPAEQSGLLGVVAGHFDDMAELTVSRDAYVLPDGSRVRAPVNTGVGVVTPARYITETLQLEELVEMRKDIEAERAAYL